MTPSSFRLTNPGGLYGITVDRLGIHPLTSPRNRRLLEICKYLRTSDGNMVEALASGIPATFASLRAAKMRDPQFFDQGLAFTVTLDRSEFAENPTTTSVKSPLTRAEKDVFVRLDGEMSAESISQALGITINAAQKRLTSLRAKGFVVMRGGPGRPSTYLQA
jgi:ATP-dependent DNA helicase RecG